eukprot:TRINITY_DN32497_c0_g1_i1.p1 TRINITY_DN32497_c0_g1~~TRINITY_DN32497_c0_g1_i1.p1  ORF type:complete len:338 (+),score=37.00 TRINITY_DN32497_c0_g1_i1:102-1115(+)
MTLLPATIDPARLSVIFQHFADEGLPGDGEFLFMPQTTTEKLAAAAAAAAWQGYLPMTSRKTYLAFKLHRERCVLPTSELHIGKKVRKRSKDYRLTVNTAWDAVCQGIEAHTFTRKPGDCWLIPWIQDAYAAVNALPCGQRRGVSFHSIELWHVPSGELVAGEIGYTCGCVYSSCTGFAMKDEFPGAGSVQLAALGRWLLASGFQLWDLGMSMPYKCELGAACVSKGEWLERIRLLRHEPAELRCPNSQDGLVSELLTEATRTGPNGARQKPAEHRTDAGKAISPPHVAAATGTQSDILFKDWMASVVSRVSRMTAVSSAVLGHSRTSTQPAANVSI